MEIVFLCLERGTKIYAVRRNGLDVFAGALEECERFLQLHTRKVLDEREEAKRPARARPFTARTYRARSPNVA